MAVRQRGSDVIAAQPVESFPAIWPGAQLPPAAEQRFPAGYGQPDAAPCQHAGQRLPLQGVEVAPRRTTAESGP